MPGGRVPLNLLFPEIDIDESEFGGVSYQIHGAVKIELFHDIGTVVLDGFYADAESSGDV